VVVIKKKVEVVAEPTAKQWLFTLMESVKEVDLIRMVLLLFLFTLRSGFSQN
jgi:hypothetical protein